MVTSQLSHGNNFDICGSFHTVWRGFDISIIKYLNTKLQNRKPFVNRFPFGSYFITSYSPKMFCIWEIKACVCVVKAKGWRTSEMFENWWSFIQYCMKSYRDRRRVSLNERKISITKPFNHYQSFFRAILIPFLSYYCVGFDFEFWQNIPLVKRNNG